MGSSRTVLNLEDTRGQKYVALASNTLGLGTERQWPWPQGVVNCPIDLTEYLKGVAQKNINVTNFLS